MTPTIDFYQFYQQLIKGRVQKKLEEEEEKKFIVEASYPLSIPAVTIDLDSDSDDASHPPVLMMDENSSPEPMSSPPRKAPRRKAGARNLSSMG